MTLSGRRAGRLPPLRKILKAAGFAVLSMALAAIIVGCLVAPSGYGFTVWRWEALALFLALTAYSIPAALIAGLPLAFALPRMLWPSVGLVIGAANWMFLSWLDGYFTGPGISVPWMLIGGAHGLAAGIFAFLIQSLLRRVPVATGDERS
jgi:hypothetical protein